MSAFDTVVYGATGYTGRLICEKLHKRSQVLGTVSWAMAGRSRKKLESLRDELNAMDVGIIVADDANPESIEAMVSATKIVVIGVGPYQLYGGSLIEACCRSGTDYIDINGEPLWMRDMIDRYGEGAKASGARILFCCGFDSIPSELGVWYTQREARRKFGRSMPRVRARVRKFIGGPSGGSAASGMSTMKRVAEDPNAAALLADPFALTPGFTGPEHPSDQQYREEPDVGPVGPFILGPTDTKNVHRSNYLMGHPYGEDFIYDELLIGATPADVPEFSPEAMPKPGEGPSAELVENGCFEFLFIASDGENELRTCVQGHHDPYEETALLVTETAICLKAAERNFAGMWTPVAALQDALFEQVIKYTGVRCSVENG